MSGTVSLSALLPGAGAEEPPPSRAYRRMPSPATSTRALTTRTARLTVLRLVCILSIAYLPKMVPSGTQGNTPRWHRERGRPSVQTSPHRLIDDQRTLPATGIPIKSSRIPVIAAPRRGRLGTAPQGVYRVLGF